MTHRSRWLSSLVAAAAIALFTAPACSDESSGAGGEEPEAHAEGEWCAGHGLPESKCTKCNPELTSKFKEAGDWCDEHGFPESACPTCNPMEPPDSAAGAADWCEGHGLPESKCTKCNPELTSKFKEAGDWCDEHGFPESACPVCNPVEAPAGAESSPIAPGTRIRFRKPDIERSAGVRVVEAERDSLGVGVEATARLEFDENRVADIRSSVPGVVREVLVDLGEEVGEGDPLFVLESQKVGDLQGKIRAAKERVETARSDFERQKELEAIEVASSRAVEVARQELESAEADLRSVKASLRIAGASGRTSGGRYRVRAPTAGTVVRRPATVGTFAGPEVSLATVADTSTMWAILDIREGDAAAVSVGDSVALRIDGLEDQRFSGELTWIASEVDRKTRTVAARAVVENPDGSLRARQFARAIVDVEPAEGVVVIPRAAVQRVKGEQVAFVRTGNGLYEPRIVDTGRSSEERVRVEGDVDPGEQVVTEGAFLLKTELMKGSIGAGCCEVEGPGGGE